MIQGVKQTGIQIENGVKQNRDSDKTGSKVKQELRQN